MLEFSCASLRAEPGGHGPGGPGRRAPVSKWGLVVLALGFLAAPSGSQAASIFWDIDPLLSSLTLNVPDQTVNLDGTNATIQLRNATSNTTWNQGRTAAIDGTIATQYDDGLSIQFLAGQHSAFGLASGNFRPNPADFDPLATNAENPDGQFVGTSTAAAVFAARVRAQVSFLTVDAAWLAFRDVFYDFASAPLAIGGGGTFAGNAVSLGVDSALVSLDGLSIILVGQPIPDTPGTLFQDITGLNSLAGATVTTPDPFGNPNLRQLTIPVNVPLMLALEGTMLNASATGQVVAFAMVPEPATLLLFGLGLGLGGLRLGSRRRA